MPQQPEKPQQPQLPNDTRTQAIGSEELPYVNEVEAALARKPRLGARFLSLAVGLFFLILGIWANFAEIDEVTHANGQVISSQRTQIIQNLEGGILGAVLVGEGEIVEKGTPLAQLDNKLAESQYRDAQNRILENELSIIRLDAELKGESPAFPEDLSVSHPQAIADQMAIFHAREQQQNAEMGLLQSQYEQRSREVEELTGRKRQTERSLALAVEQRNIAAPLMQRKIYSRVDYLGLEQKVVSLQGDIESLASSIPKAQAAAEEAKQRLTLRKAEMEAEINAEISKRRTELNSLKETLAAGGDRVTRTELKSPVRGTVKQAIYINTVGGVVKPGEAIMEIVPLDDTLLVEARVRPAGRGLPPSGAEGDGQASPRTIFPSTGGLRPENLEQISADTIEDERGESLLPGQGPHAQERHFVPQGAVADHPRHGDDRGYPDGQEDGSRLYFEADFEGPAERLAGKVNDPSGGGFCVLAGLLAVSIFVGLPYPGAFAADDDDEILLKRSSVGSLLSNRNKAEGARVAAPSRPASSRNPSRARAGTGGAGGPGWKAGEGGPIRLFGTLEMRSKIGKMPKWTSVLEKERKNPGYVANRQFPGQGAWKDIKAKLSGMSPLEQVKAVNVLINRWPYRTDMDVWGVMDYWETPVEFFQKSGDCEDFAIAKYFALRDLGFPASQMRIVVLKDTLRNLDHAVTAVYLDGDAWILDNLSNAVLSHKRLSHYRPQFSVNEEYRWAHLTPSAPKKTGR